MKYHCISDNFDTLTGLRLAGIGGTIAGTRREAQDALTKCISDPEIGIVLITEKLAKFCPELIGDLKLKEKRTLVVEIPDRHGTGRDPNSITHYIREAIGIKI